MEVIERFAELVATPQFPLDEVAVLIALRACPEADVADCRAELDRIAADVSSPTLESLVAAVFGTHGFAGDQRSYYDPANSYLPEVLRTRRGIPLTLSLVLMEVGRRAGVELVGIGTPAHFMTRTTDGTDRYVDAFAGGRILVRDELTSFFARLAPGVELEPHLEPVGSLTIVSRLLSNLVAVHQRAGDRDALLWTSRLRTLVPGATAAHRRAYGGALAACGDFALAAKVIESLVEDGHTTDPERELAAAQRLRARLN